MVGVYTCTYVLRLRAFCIMLYAGFQPKQAGPPSGSSVLYTWRTRSQSTPSCIIGTHYDKNEKHLEVHNPRLQISSIAIYKEHLYIIETPCTCMHMHVISGWGWLAKLSKQCMNPTKRPVNILPCSNHTLQGASQLCLHF